MNRREFLAAASLGTLVGILANCVRRHRVEPPPPVAPTPTPRGVIPDGTTLNADVFHLPKGRTWNERDLIGYLDHRLRIL